MRDFFVMFGSQLAAYLLITANYRSVARGDYFWTAATDLTFAAFNFGLIRRIAKSETRAAWAGYVLGGCCGSLLGIFCSRFLKGF